MDLVTVSDVREAAKRIEGVTLRTPLVPWTPGLWLKPENLQPTGAFKLRGAANAVAALPAGVPEVVTHSSGNHGQALAYAARAHGVTATVVVPKVAPTVKVEAMRALGAEIILVDSAERSEAAIEIAESRGAPLIPPFDHRDIIAGQGTIGLEILDDLPAVDLILVPVGGGGLSSGVATVVKALSPGTRVIGVEPALAADALDSLTQGHLVTWDLSLTYRTIADGVRTNLSELTFAHLSAYLDGIVTVTEDEIRSAVGALARSTRLVAEPTGALTTAAYLFHREELKPAGRTVAVISGGNLDPALLAECITLPGP